FSSRRRHTRSKRDWSSDVCSSDLTAALKEQLAAVFDQAYGDEPFVRVLPDGQWPQTAATTGSNVAQIQFTVDERAQKILVVVALDNLVRGTAGQAIQSIHLALGLDETTALPLTGVAP